MQGYAVNKKATFNYQIVETYEAGIVLFGFEVKAIKTGKAQLQGSYVVIEDDEVFLVNCYIAPYQPHNTPADYNTNRKRKLLLHRNEIDDLLGRKSAAGLTVVPIKMYNKNNAIKVSIALARGKKTHDKRETIKRKDIAREIARRGKLK